MDLSIHVMIIAALAVVVIGLAIYKRTICPDEEECLDLHHLDNQTVTNNAAMAARLEKIDRITLALAGFLVLYGIGVGATLLYHEWQNTGTTTETR